jgi:hypothetical protein
LDITLLDKDQKQVAIDRLTALWALNEAGLGGLLHAFQLPFKGVFIGGIAVIIISLIGYIAEEKFRAILKATIIVMIIKLLVTPYTPLTAYFAVSFQGITGAIIFKYIKNIRISSLVLAVLSFAESSLQRLIVLTIIFGNPLWESINIFFDYVLKETGLMKSGASSHASLWIIDGYLFIYMISGILIGLYSGNLPSELKKIPERMHDENITRIPEPIPHPLLSGKPKTWWRTKKVGFLILLFFITVTLFLITPEAGWGRGLYVIARALLMIGIWFLFISPWVTKWFSRFLNRQRSKYSRDVEQVLLTLPSMKKYVITAWNESGKLKYISRIKLFLVCLVNEVLVERND